MFGYGVYLGQVGSTPVSTLFSLGLCQDEAVQFLGADGLVTLPSLWKSYFLDDIDALTFFQKDFPESSRLSSVFDNQISKDSIAAAGQDYATLTTLAARQAFAATQLVGTDDKHYLFMKEISSNGNTQTIDVIYPASPISIPTRNSSNYCLIRTLRIRRAATILTSGPYTTSVRTIRMRPVILMAMTSPCRWKSVATTSSWS